MDYTPSDYDKEQFKKGILFKLIEAPVKEVEVLLVFLATLKIPVREQFRYMWE
jgi:hypothetical protein